jgi:hypothetical protein
MIEEETQMKAILGLVSGFVTTLNTRGDKSPAEMGRAKRGGLRGIRRVLMERRRHIAVLAIILYFFYNDSIMDATTCEDTPISVTLRASLRRGSQ